ncbi:MAG: ASKHA domain-containing protein [Candidatus Omnitrophota bacterium]
MRNIKKLKVLPKNDPLINKISFPSGLSFVLDNDELLKIEQTNSKHIFGIAVDLGTTSICVSLCNLENNQELATATCDNQQDKFALLLISRKKFRSASKENQKNISQTVLQSINKALDECIRKSGVNRNNIYIAVLVGSPIMQQILLSIPESAKQSISQGIAQVKAAIAGININPAANVKFIPGLNEHIGSDILASIMSLKILESARISLCVDLGMRAKIIIGNQAGVFIGSTSISSVFEGHNIKCGMVTQSGAIEWARINTEKVDILTIGHIRPQGICGSGIIDIVSEMLSNNILKPNAQMQNKSFVLYEDKKSRIEITSQDIKKVQESKAAVAAAIKILMNRLKLNPAKIKKVYFAGQLGDYVNVDNLIRIGLIPAGFKPKTSYVGNSAFLGAKLALLSKKNMSKIIQSAGKIKHIMLEDDKNFKKEFTQALAFPK